MSVQTVDLSTLWLPLLSELTQSSSRWGIWKNIDAAFRGSGDVDSTAPTEDWQMIEAAFVRWARANGFDPVTACRHVSGVLFLVAIDPRTRVMHELDVNARKFFRAWTMFRPDDLSSLMEMDPRGVRRVRTGTEGLIQLMQNGTKWGGRMHQEGLSVKQVIPKLNADPVGVAEGASMFGPARAAAATAARDAAFGGWNRSAMLAVEARAVLGSFVEPHIALKRVWSRRVKARCPVLQTIFRDDRSVPADLDAWIQSVASSHPVYRLGG